MKPDFSGWATVPNRKCSDGAIIMPDALTWERESVPLVWNHQHNSPSNILGKAFLTHRDGGVWCDCFFNDTENASTAKAILKHGDIEALSICANKLKRAGASIAHGIIREVSLVLAGANPGAFIESVSIEHGDDGDMETAIIYNDEPITIDADEEVTHSAEGKKEEPKMAEPAKKADKTIGDIIETMNEEQKTALNYLVSEALKEKSGEDDNKEGESEMKHNAFDNENNQNDDLVITHADQMDILKLAQQRNVGTFKNAMKMWLEEQGQTDDTIEHSFEKIGELFPEYKDLKTGAPETLTRDQGWVSVVLNKVHKSPIARIRTKIADARAKELRALGYKTGDKKKNTGNIKLLSRTTDPQTIYVKDELNRDDVLDITDFDVVSYLQGNMRANLNEEIAMAIMIGDGREEGDENKISEEHIRSIWNDDDLYTIHGDIDFEGAKNELQGSDTDKHFSENYIKAEAMIRSALYLREKYKGTGTPDFFCTPHMVNVMLLARDFNGRRIYDSKADLAKALNVNDIYTAEQFEDKIRVTKEGKKKKLVGIFMNLADYQVGAAKGGEITSFDDFDIDFNQYKYLLETRISGANKTVYSAIALEEDVTEAQG